MEAASTFAVASDAYARSRPSYPDALFDWIADQCAAREAAWDCATGNGQAAVALARRFARVEATDISPQQLAQAFQEPNIRYAPQRAERTDFTDASFDVVTVAQALHWFDFDKFWPEVRRVTRPGGLFCAWGYGGFEAEPAVMRTYVRPLLDLLEPFWAKENQILWRGYGVDEVRFPFPTLAPPSLRLVGEQGAPQLVEYVRTWSAYKRADADTGRRLEALETEFVSTMADELIRIETPLVVLAGRVD
ncbi:MAG TPA: class I SAM-dependent methyltransferase [Caulobacteraceae bacterium]|jgi:SAM-dependent methyltransferase|nr:class I SAM-dependent methyltransferase [Caulobacteraceae bacterium]